MAVTPLSVEALYEVTALGFGLGFGCFCSDLVRRCQHGFCAFFGFLAKLENMVSITLAVPPFPSWEHDVSSCA